MLRITRTTDYGVLLLTRIASGNTDEVHAARDLAAETGIPLPMVSKTLKLLTRGDLLESTRGSKGGYRLGRDASEISVASIIAALEGPIALTDCSVEDAENTCTIESLCPTRDHWQHISRVVREALEGMSLADMACPTLAMTTAALMEQHEASDGVDNS